MMRAIPASLLLASVMAGCGYGGGEAEPSATGCGEPIETVIDTGAELEITPGEGVGFFIEYLGAGQWRAQTTCDTAQSGAACSWDIVITPLADSELFDFSAEGFDENDSIGFEHDGSLRAVLSTEGDVDGVRFEATEGASLRVDVLLDGYCANPYIYWVGDGAVHTGSPSNPVVFTPSA